MTCRNKSPIHFSSSATPSEIIAEIFDTLELQTRRLWDSILKEETHYTVNVEVITLEMEKYGGASPSQASTRDEDRQFGGPHDKNRR